MLRGLLVLALGAMLVAAPPAAAKPHKTKKPPASLKAIWGPNTLPDGTSAGAKFGALPPLAHEGVLLTMIASLIFWLRPSR